MKDKKCKIIGYSIFNKKDDNGKETGEQFLRIILGIKSDAKSYYGTIVAPALFLEYSEELEKQLRTAIDEEKIISYETEENILTGKVKITSLSF